MAANNHDEGKNELLALTGASLAAANGFQVNLSRSVVLVFDQSLTPRSSSFPGPARRDVHRKATHPFRAITRTPVGVDVVVAPGPGAPVAAITVEFLAALGVGRVVTVGSAGHLRAPSLVTPPQRWLVERAESDEGTSKHYGDHTTPDELLCQHVANHLGATLAVSLTTDVPFRHTPGRLATHRERADLVEMECAAVFAAAHHFGIAAASVLVTSDAFVGNEWQQLATGATHTLLCASVLETAQALAELDSP